MYGLSTINIELTSRCNKECFCCGRRKLEKVVPGWRSTLGDMDYQLFKKIAAQIPPGTVVQLHWNGEPTLYTYLEEAIDNLRQQGCWVCLNTNGLLLWAKRDAINRLHSVTVSIISDDTDEMWHTQAEQLVKYCALRPDTGPVVNLRLLGDRVPYKFIQIAERYGLTVVKRIFHSPDMSRDYEKPVTLPEIGVCLDLLTHPAIDRHGHVYSCVRFNPNGWNCYGDLKEESLEETLSGSHRIKLIKNHFSGKRALSSSLCASCDFYGVPTGW